MGQAVTDADGPAVVRGDFETLPELMDAAASQIGDREAYVDGTRRLTFAEWIRAADAAAGHLAGQGVRPGDVVALHLAPSIDYAVCYAAIVRLGAIATGVNPRHGPRECSGIAARCRPRVVVTESKGGSAGDADAGIWGEATVVPLEEVVGAEPGPPPARKHRGVASDPVAIIWTSGTTGASKGAWFDHRNMAAAVASGGAMTAPFDRRISAIPMVHAGYMSKLWEQLAMGVTIVLSPLPWSAESMLEVLVNERISVAAGVPTQWAKLLTLPEIETADLSALRIGLSATAPAPPELIERVVQVIGCPLVVRYAMTECPSITGTEPTDAPEIQFRTVGRPQAGMKVELVDEQGGAVPDGEVGRIRVSGPCVMRGYWNDPERTAEVLGDEGALTTSDLGRIDEAGHLVLAGRVDDMYIRGGYNVYPVEVEAVLAEHPEIAEVAVVGKSADVIGEIGVAFVVPRDRASILDLEALRSFVGERLADYKRPDQLELVDSLPLTAMSKVDKQALRRRLAERPGGIASRG